MIWFVLGDKDAAHKVPVEVEFMVKRTTRRMAYVAAFALCVMMTAQTICIAAI